VKKSVGLSANVNKGSVRSCGLNSGLHLRYSVHGISAAAASSSLAMKREVVRTPVQSAHWQDALQVKAGAALALLVLKLRVKGVLGANAIYRHNNRRNNRQNDSVSSVPFCCNERHHSFLFVKTFYFLRFGKFSKSVCRKNLSSFSKNCPSVISDCVHCHLCVCAHSMIVSN